MTCLGPGNKRLIHSQQGASPNRRDDDVAAGSIRARPGNRKVFASPSEWTVLYDGRRFGVPATEARRKWESRKERSREVAEAGRRSVSRHRGAGGSRRRALYHRHDRPARSHGGRGASRPAWLISSGWRKRKASSLFAPMPSLRPSAKPRPKRPLTRLSPEFTSPTRAIRSTEASLGSSSSALARRATRSPEYSIRPASSSSSSATRTARAGASAARPSSSSVIGDGPSSAMMRSRAASASSPIW